MKENTIVAIATPPGRGGVAIVRLSGPSALSIANQITGKSLQPRHVTYCMFYDFKQQVIDQGLALYFKTPHSFTGEEVVELHAHGSPIILDRIITVCVNLGATIAKPGEFSERAFLNGKLDLAQAEAIADLIDASSETAARMAIRSLQGEFSQKIEALNEKIVHLRLYVEAAIDFPEEEIDFLNDGKIATALNTIINQLDQIRSNANQGSKLREGLSIVIAGRPNAGKSTLINRLAGYDVAIVTEIPGTTRDVMREHILLDDIPIHLVDTAGLRESDDLVEQEGIKRAWKEVQRADCVLLLIDIDAQQDVNQLSEEMSQALPPKVPVIRIYNKIDRLEKKAYTEDDAIYLSAKSGDGIDLLKTKIKKVVGYQPQEGLFLARRRHLDALNKAHELLINGVNQLVVHRAGELLAEDLRLAHQSLGEITGKFSSDDLLGKIFSSFCIGK